ncbi:hypothetical protein D3C86_1859310 [compost metagenome]
MVPLLIGALPQSTTPPQLPGVAAGEVKTTGEAAVPFAKICPPCSTTTKAEVPPEASNLVPAGITNLPPSRTITEPVIL